MATELQSRPMKVPPWPVVGTLCQRELVRFFRQKNRVFGALGQPIIFWLLFATISIIEDRREGFLQGVLVAPIPRWTMVLGKVLGGAAIAMLQGIVFLLLGWIGGKLGWFEVISPTLIGLFAALVLMFVVSVALTGLGFLIAWRMDSTQGFHAIMSVFLLPMWLLSGAFFPMDVGGWLGWIIAINPLTYGVAGLRYYLQNVDVAAAPPSLCWIVSLAFAGMLLAADCWIAGKRTTGDLL
jgi:ABC-2 type transport system permease protein